MRFLCYWIILFEYDSNYVIKVVNFLVHIARYLVITLSDIHYFNYLKFKDQVLMADENLHQ